MLCLQENPEVRLGDSPRTGFSAAEGMDSEPWQQKGISNNNALPDSSFDIYMYVYIGRQTTHAETPTKGLTDEEIRD